MSRGVSNVVIFQMGDGRVGLKHIEDSLTGL